MLTWTSHSIVHQTSIIFLKQRKCYQRFHKQKWMHAQTAKGWNTLSMIKVYSMRHYLTFRTKFSLLKSKFVSCNAKKGFELYMIWIETICRHILVEFFHTRRHKNFDKAWHQIVFHPNETAWARSQLAVWNQEVSMNVMFHHFIYRLTFLLR